MIGVYKFSFNTESYTLPAGYRGVLVLKSTGSGSVTIFCISNNETPEIIFGNGTMFSVTKENNRNTIHMLIQSLLGYRSEGVLFGIGE